MDCNLGLVGPTFVTGVILGSIYALIALGYTMVYGVLKLINFAHDAVFVVGAVGVFYVFGEWFGLTEPMSGLGLLFVMLASLLVGGIVSAIGAALLERAAYRPLRKRGAARLSFLISAIGASFFITYMFQQGFLLGPGKRAFPGFMLTQPTFRLFSSTVTNTKLLTVVAAVVCLIILDRIINQTKTGRSIRALSEDIVASQLMGVNIDRVILTTFLIGGFFGGVAGTLYGLQFGFVVWNMGFIPGLKAFTAAVLGGIGNIRGAMIGGIMLGLIENMSTVCIGSEWKNVVAFTVLVLVLILRPTGIMGERIGGLMSSNRPDAPTNFIAQGWERLGFVRYLIAAALMALLPILMDKDIIPVLNGSFGVAVLFITGVWILLALGLSVVVGLAGLLDLGYIAFFMLGAYVTALMTDSGGPEQFHVVTWPTWAALPFAVLVAMAAGLLIGAPTLRLRGDYLAIVTLGFHEIVRQGATNLAFLNQSRGIAGIPNPQFNLFGQNVDFGLDNEMYWWFLLIPAILGAVIMIKRLNDSRVGRYWTAIREDEVAAAAMGVPVVKMKLWAFVIGASTSGVAGWIYAVNFSYIAPNSFPLLNSILVLCAVVIGGLGSIAGAVVGAILIQTLPEVVRELSNGKEIFGFDPETGRIVIFGLLLIIVMIYRPGGLLAPKRRRTELQEAGQADAVLVSDSVTSDEPTDDRPTGEDGDH